MEFLKLENISFSYDGKNKIIDDFSLELDKNQILSIIGPSGCGKSTLLRIISGLERAAGNIYIDDKLIASDKIFIEAEDRNVAMVFQDYALFPHLSVYNNIKYGLSNLKKEEREDRINYVIKMVELQEHIKKYPYQLSGGQQQRLALARSLAPRPKLLLLDEPFSNLDANLKNQIRGDLKLIIEKFNITTILVTHDIEDATYMSDKIIKMS